MADYNFPNDRTDKRVRNAEINNWILSNKNYVISGCAVSQGTGMQITVASGSVYIDGTGTVSVTGNNITLTSSDPSQDRCDLIAINTSGVAVKIDGTPGTPPETPEYDEFKMG